MGFWPFMGKLVVDEVDGGGGLVEEVLDAGGIYAALDVGAVDDACEEEAIELLLFLRLVNPSDFSREVMGTECAHTRSQEGGRGGEERKERREREGREKKRRGGRTTGPQKRALL